MAERSLSPGHERDRQWRRRQRWASDAHWQEASQPEKQQELRSCSREDSDEQVIVINASAALTNGVRSLTKGLVAVFEALRCGAFAGPLVSLVANLTKTLKAR